MKKASHLKYAKAECMVCGWKAEGKNAVAIGAKHAKRHCHKVVTEQTIETTYGIMDSEEEPEMLRLMKGEEIE